MWHFHFAARTVGQFSVLDSKFSSRSVRRLASTCSLLVRTWSLPSGLGRHSVESVPGLGAGSEHFRLLQLTATPWGSNRAKAFGVVSRPDSSCTWRMVLLQLVCLFCRCPWSRAAISQSHCRSALQTMPGAPPSVRSRTFVSLAGLMQTRNVPVELPGRSRMPFGRRRTSTLRITRRDGLLRTNSHELHSDFRSSSSSRTSGMAIRNSPPCDLPKTTVGQVRC